MGIEGNSQMAEGYETDAWCEAKPCSLILIPVTACNLLAIGQS